jgi:hypothetical protein
MALAERVGELAASSAMSWQEVFGVVIGAAGLLDAAARERDRLRAAVDDVLALHRKSTIGNWAYCELCESEESAVGWPCETVRALAPVAATDPHTTSDKEQQ